MSRQQEARDALVRQIRSAFSDVEYPGDDGIVPDHVGWDPDVDEVGEAFAGKRWQDVTSEDIASQRDGLCFMTPEAFRFYLPAYLLACILDYDEADTAFGCAIMLLTEPRPGDRRYRAWSEAWFQKRVEAMTADQRLAIRRFLEYVGTEHCGDDPLGEIGEALRRYWRNC